MPHRTPGYRELLVLLGILVFAASLTGSFWVVFLYSVLPLAPAEIAALFGAGALVAVVVATGMSRAATVPSRTAMIAGLLSLAGTNLAFAFLPGPPLFALFPILWGAYIPLFFLPWNVLFTSETRAHDRGAKLAGILLVSSLATMGAPFLGGVIADAWGFPALFVLGASLLGFDAVLARTVAKGATPVRLRWNPSALGRGTTVAYAAQGGIDGVLWTAIPLATFSFVQEKVELGLVFSLFALTGGVVAMYLGRWSDRIRHRWRFIALGTTFAIPLAVAVALAPNLVGFTAANGALSATLAIAPTFVNAAVVDRLEGEIGPVMLTREVLLNVSRGATSVALLCMFLLHVPVQLAVLMIAVLLPFEALAERRR